MKKRTLLAYTAAGVGGAAIAGYGMGIGRDAWRYTKKNYLAILILISLFASLSLPYLGARNIVRGYPPRMAITAAARHIASLILVVLGAAMAFGLSIIAFSLLSEHPQPETATLAVIVALITTVPAVAFGLIVGLFQRPGRLRRFATAKVNEIFLKDIGFRETGEEEITHYDSEGNALRYMERSKDAIVFLAVGRRNRRAYIKLDKDGLMTGYTGVIGINEPRDYRAA